MARPTAKQAPQQQPPAPEQEPQVVIDPIKQLRQLVGKLEPFFKQAFPRSVGLDPQRFVRVCINAIESDDSGKLLQCSPGSIARSLLHSAEVGLEPGGALGHAYLIPYWNKDRGVYEAQFQIGVWGLIALARRSGDILDVWARCVYEGDFFEEHGGSEPKLIHRPQPFAADDRGCLGAYACAKLKDGTVNWITVSEADCQRARSMNRGKSPAWDVWPDEMRKKVAIRRGSKTWPKSIEDTEAWAQALAIEDGAARLRPDLAEGLQRMLGTSLIGISGGSKLDQVVAARKTAQDGSAPQHERQVAPEPDRQPQGQPAPAPRGFDDPETYDPSTGEVAPKDEPPMRQPGED